MARKEHRHCTFLTLHKTPKGATGYHIPDEECTAGFRLYLCVCVRAYTPAGVCAPAQLKVNSLRLSDSTLKSGRDWQRERGETERRSIPDIAPVFNAPQSLDNKRSNHLFIVCITRYKLDILRLSICHWS